MPTDPSTTADTGADRDVTEILTTDHHAVLDLIAEIGSSTDAAQRRDLADTVIAELVRHSVAEEMFVYPAMRQHLDDGDAQVQHDIKEHQELEEALKALEGTDADDADFTPRVAKVEELLRHHASDEEEHQFPKLRAALPADALAELGRKVELAKVAAPTRPHPASPHAALFHKTLGPGVGLVDKLRDALAGRSTHA